MSQFADDTNLFCADLTSVENALRTVGDFGVLAGLNLNIKKTSKGIWLGKWEKNKLNPLQLKCRFGIKPDDDCLYCGETDSVDHSFKDCRFVISFETEVIKWFNARNNSKFNPAIEEKLFGLDKSSYNKELEKKFNYTMLFMRYYIYSCLSHTGQNY